MPLTITINDAGQSVLEIADWKGRVWQYRWQILPRGYSLWLMEVTRTDTEATYYIDEDLPGHWRCTCPDEFFRKRGQKRKCKHIAAARALRAFLRELTKESEHARRSQAS